jgi:hypothetical protein
LLAPVSSFVIAGRLFSTGNRQAITLIAHWNDKNLEESGELPVDERNADQMPLLITAFSTFGSRIGSAALTPAICH